jgi:CelD/BcsL family acetyltransferase involved in cellulose biosynthesis
MNFPKGLDDLLRGLGRSQRSRLRRKYKKLVSGLAGKAQVRSFRSLADLEPAISDMEKIASRTDKRLLFGVGFFDTPQIREQLAVAAENGWLRIYILYLDEKPVAFWRGTVYKRCLQADDVAHDPVWSEFSPGICLFLNVLEDLQVEDIKMVDLCFGDIQFKQCFGDLRRIESRVHIYAPTLRGLQLNLLGTATQRATDRAKFLLRRARCLQWASRALRNQLVRQRRKRCSIAGSNPSSCDDVRARHPSWPEESRESGLK